MFINISIVKVVSTSSCLYLQIIDGMWLNNMRKIHTKWILLPITDSLPAPLLQTGRITYRTHMTLTSTRVSCPADSCCQYLEHGDAIWSDPIKGVPSAVGFPHCAGSGEGLFLSPKPYPHKCAEAGARTRDLPVTDGPQNLDGTSRKLG